MVPRLVRRVAAVLVGILILLAVHSCTRGLLFPWSPLKPGYAAASFERATLFYPRATDVRRALGDLDLLLAEVEEEVRLRARVPVRVVVAGTWGLFNRGTMLGFSERPFPVLGAALQTGTVIYLSPLAFESDRDPRAVVRHELVHALLFQQMPLRRCFELTRLDWFEEGQAMLFSHSTDARYLDDRTWRTLAGREYCAGFLDEACFARLPQEQRALFRLAEYRLFVQFLIARHGADAFFRYRDAVLENPARQGEVFHRVLGESFAEAVHAFERGVAGGTWPPRAR